jgi:2'-5'-oligoadenylate synthetase
MRNYKNFDSNSYNKIYTQLIHECITLKKKDEFLICFTDIHQNFLRYRAPRLWTLLCLVKHWYQLCKEKLREPLSPQYPLELLTVYAWECRLQDSSGLHTAQCF